MRLKGSDHDLTYGEARVLLDRYLFYSFSSVAESENRLRQVSGRPLFEYGFADDRPHGDGTTHVEFREDRLEFTSVRIGLSSKFSAAGKFSGVIADDYELMQAMVAIPHERQHVLQLLDDCSRSDSPSPMIFANLLSQQGNEAYYNENYSLNPCEVDAQRFGVLDVHRLLSTLAGVAEADRLILLYQNTRQEALRRAHDSDLAKRERLRAANDPSWETIYVFPLDFIDDGREYHSVRAVFKAYGKVFRKSLHAVRTYDFDHSTRDVAVMRMAELPDEVRSKCISIFLAERDGFRQDVMVASLLFDQGYQAKYVLPEIEKRTGLKLLRSDAFRPAGLPERIRSAVPARNPSYDAESRFGCVLEGKTIQGPEDGFGGDGPR